MNLRILQNDNTTMGIEAFLLDRAKKEGREEARVEEKLHTARKLKELGVALDIIMATTGLSKEVILKL